MLPTDDRLSGLTEVRNPVSSSTLKRPPHLKALTSVRALAALYVGVYHMVRPFEQWGRFTGFWGAGYSAVSFFFFLSGFILVYTHGVEFASGKGDTKRFLVARFARVYPLYLLVTIVAGILGYKAFHPAYHVIAYVAQVFMLQSWHIRLTPFFNIVAWSLSEEAFFYCCFPFVAARLQPRSLRHGVVLLLGLCVLALVPGLIAMYFDPLAAWHETAATSGSHHMLYFVRRFPPLMLPQFLCGIVAGWIYLQRPVSEGWAKLALVCGGTALFSALLLAKHLPFILLHNGLLIPCYVLILYGLTRPNLVSNVLSWTPFVLAGEASYAFYLIHFMFNDWAKSLFHWPDTIAGLIPRFVVLIPLSILLHFFVERPGRRWVMSWWDGRTAARA
ncbi:acyltransferase family protein [Terriglobus sp. RCC_193]|uniref:acyltransferase family protein n=1 Tax=Terriglobus sp. RCC_193 TaxID=3239218 RepID=UPI003524756E